MRAGRVVPQDGPRGTPGSHRAVARARSPVRPDGTLGIRPPAALGLPRGVSEAVDRARVAGDALAGREFRLMGLGRGRKAVARPTVDLLASRSRPGQNPNDTPALICLAGAPSGVAVDVRTRLFVSIPGRFGGVGEGQTNAKALREDFRRAVGVDVAGGPDRAGNDMAGSARDRFAQPEPGLEVHGVRADADG